MAGFRLQDRDCEIIKAIHDCRVLLIRQVETLFFGSPKPAYGRLKKLHENGFLQRHHVPQVGLSPASSTLLYTISPLGAEVLAKVYGYTSTDLYVPTKQFLDWKTLNPLVEVNDVRVAVTKASRADGFKLVQWVDGFTFRSRPDSVSIAGRQRKKPVLPDGFAHLHTPKGDLRILLEIDRGTDGLQQFKNQLLVYQAYLASGAYAKRFNSPHPHILVITTTAQRLQLLTKAVMGVGGGDVYWFSLMELVTPEHILTQPIWVKADGATPAALVGL